MSEIEKPWIVVETNEQREATAKAFESHKRAAHYINYKILGYLQNADLHDTDYRLIQDSDESSREAFIYDPPGPDYYWIDWYIFNIHEMQYDHEHNSETVDSNQS